MERKPRPRGDGVLEMEGRIMYGEEEGNTCVRYCCWPNRRKDLAVCRLLVTLMNSFVEWIQERVEGVCVKTGISLLRNCVVKGAKK